MLTPLKGNLLCLQFRYFSQIKVVVLNKLFIQNKGVHLLYDPIITSKLNGNCCFNDYLHTRPVNFTKTEFVGMIMFSLVNKWTSLYGKQDLERSVHQFLQNHLQKQKIQQEICNCKPCDCKRNTTVCLQKFIIDYLDKKNIIFRLLQK